MGRGRGTGNLTGGNKNKALSAVAELRNSLEDVSEIPKNYQEVFDAGLEYLDEEVPFFLTHVLNIGKPEWINDIPTAAVAFEENKKDFRFVFNPEFAESLSDADMGFVSAHETMHILLNHLELSQKFDNHQMFNLAADAVINDYLINQGLEGPDGLVYGDALIGENCAELSVAEVYEQLERDQQQKEEDQGEAGSGGDGEKSDGDGSGEQPEEGDEFGNGSGLPEFRSLDDHSWMNDSNEKEQEAAEQVYEDTKDTLPEEIVDMKEGKDNTPRFATSGTGSGVGPLQEWRDSSGVKLAWEDLLKEIDPDILKDLSKAPPERASFARRPRRLAGFPDTILPVTHKPEKDLGKNKEKPTIVMALDTSGSIGEEQARRFVSLAKSIPTDKVNLFTCTFTTQCIPLNLEEPRFRGGGTAFSPIERYIQSNVIGKVPEGSKHPLKEYPSAVLVVTDGESIFHNDRPTQKQLEENWHWLLTPRHNLSRLRREYRNGMDKMKKFNLSDFIK